MKHPKTVKTVSVTGGASTAVVAALAAGWIGIAALVIAIVVPIAAICWVLADPDRPQRLALLLSAWRYGTPTPLRRRVATAPRRAIDKPSATSCCGS
ncbi:hypothetical protein AB0L41_42615 [Amycolatopsis mediterranei]|uniref:hypothetical protein n=1 Tax=Amycolatopsis mediterranei TaxID=33910 RepID=UPI003447CE49